MKTIREIQYQSLNKETDIFIKTYCTKGGNLKFNIQVLKKLNNDSGFCAEVARYNTKENDLIRYLKHSDNFNLINDTLENIRS